VTPAGGAVAERYAAHVNPTFVKLLGVLGYGRVFTRARGSTLVDAEGREYLDALAGFGVHALGHNHPRVAARLRALLEEDAVHFTHVSPGVHAAELGAALAARCAPLTVALFSSTGSEAVEAALKLARAATGRRRFVACAGGYHGTGLGALGLMGEERVRGLFEPLQALGPVDRVPFGELRPLARALARKDVAAFVVEPIQAEGGVALPPPGWLREAGELCRRAGTLLVLDEIQTGLGRTGAPFAFLEEGVVPDALCLAKALSGGVVPVAATMVRPELHERAFGSLDRFDAHGTTFSGGALACAAALATLEILDDERLAERARRGGERLVAALRARLDGHPLVADVRGRGLLVGVELGARLLPRAVERLLGHWVSLRMLERGVVCQPASAAWHVIKLTPPLVIDDAELDRLAATLAAVLDECRDVPRTVLAIGRTIGSQWRNDWRF
jgi:acetylornithine/succinyldiaminopimelate/putrescine aminotransferase